MDATTNRPDGGAAVVLQVRRNGRTLVSAQGRADAHGRFAVAAPPLPAGAGYAVTTTYRGVAYSADLTAAQAARPVALSVYETTSSDSGLAAMHVAIGVRHTGSGVSVIEQWSYVNPTRRTILSGNGTATFPLPLNATQVSILDPAHGGIVQNGAVMVNGVLRPATGMNAASFHQVTFTFTLPPGTEHPTLLIPTRYFIGRLDVFAVGSQLQAPGFTNTTLQSGAQKIPALEQVAVAPNSTLAVGIDGPPGPTPFPTAPVAVLIEVGFAAVLFFALRQRLLGLRPAVESLPLQRERARLIGAIAELDAQHARGRVDETAYRKQRARQKSRLLGVARQLGE